MPDKNKQLKNSLSGPAIQRIRRALAQLLPSFDATKFEKQGKAAVKNKELKQRVAAVIAVLHTYLPRDFIASAEVLQAIPEVWDDGDKSDSNRAFAAWPLIDYVAVYGMDHIDQALLTLEKLTSLFSAEFAVRPFIEKDEATCFRHFKRWLKSENAHHRRLVSEGTRPRLPWGRHLKKYIDNPSPILPLLEALRYDESLYVRRSVANNLNDISKDHPELVVRVCHDWQADAQKKLRSASRQNLHIRTENLQRVSWIIRHATRSLVKQGHPDSFSLLGFTESPDVHLADLSLPKQIALGSQLHFEFTLRSNSHAQRFVVDYAIHYRKSNGDTSAKMFKLKNLSLGENEVIKLHKKHRFAEMTTRKHYAGEHFLSICINGKPYSRAAFDLKV